MPLSEFELINRYFRDLTAQDPSVKCGIGDDAAIIQIPEDMEVALSIDTLVEGTHFPVKTDPFDIAYKALAVNLSDMAAMGAEPKWVLLSISLPENDENWLKKFVTGFLELSKRHSVSLIGGDMSRGGLSITIQIQGLVPIGKALRREGAQKDDLVFVTGTLGDAGVGLDIMHGKKSPEKKFEHFFLDSLNRPEISIAAGLCLREFANSAIDISDGLIADLGHILAASDVGAEIEVDKIPLSAAMRGCIDEISAWNYALTAGDDYKLCFTAAAEFHDELVESFNEIDISLSCIGRITSHNELLIKEPTGNIFMPTGSSYKHF